MYMYMYYVCFWIWSALFKGSLCIICFERQNHYIIGFFCLWSSSLNRTFLRRKNLLPKREFFLILTAALCKKWAKQFKMRMISLGVVYIYLTLCLAWWCHCKEHEKPDISPGHSSGPTCRQDSHYSINYHTNHCQFTPW